MTKKAFVHLAGFTAMAAAMILGILGAGGLCALIWGASILDTALGDPPQRTHPAFITFLAVMVPGMGIGWLGAVFGIVLPMHLYFRIPLPKGHPGSVTLLRSYAKRLLELTEPKS